MTQEALKLSQEALAKLNDVEKQVRGLVAENKALKEALAEPEQEPWCMKMNGCKTKCEDCPVEVAQPEQEPVAWAHYDTFKNLDSLTTARFKATLATKNTGACCIALYTTPPQRPWVGLAAEDRLCAKYMQDAPDGIEAVIDYIEAKLKEKNGFTEEKNT